MSGQSISFHNLTYELADGRKVLSGLEGSFLRQRTGLLGDNGVGKSTLLKIIVGELKATSGSCVVHGSVGYLPQDFLVQGSLTVGEVLGVRRKLEAIRRVSAGDADPRLLEEVDGDWDVAEKASRTLAMFGLRIGLGRFCSSLSGGEQVRLNIARLVLQRNDFILLDEPTNNLDAEAVAGLYESISGYRGGVVVVSHDRELLRRVDAIAELFPDELRIYGGNYDFYLEQRQFMKEALEQDIKTKQIELCKAERVARNTDEKNAKRARRGKKDRAKAKASPIALGAWKDSAERARGTSRLLHEGIQEELAEELGDLRGRRKPENAIKIELPRTRVPEGKVVFDLKHIWFAYGSAAPLFDGFSYAVRGPKRVAIRGRNGSGKTTLAKIIMGELVPQAGEARLLANSVGYLDQFTRQLDPDLTLYESVRAVNEVTPQADIRIHLARLLFRREDVHKPTGVLSGGERMRVALAREFLKPEPPQLLILDEPTNNLDINSMERLESALACYEGALLVISHDQAFLQSIGVTDEIVLGNGSDD